MSRFLDSCSCLISTTLILDVPSSIHSRLIVVFWRTLELTFSFHIVILFFLSEFIISAKLILLESIRLIGLLGVGPIVATRSNFFRISATSFIILIL